MTERSVVRTGVSRLVLGVLMALAGPLHASEPPAQRPNFVVFMAEDLGPRIGAFGDPLAQTPNIDALAARGVRYTRAFTTAGVCAPSRAAHITGVYQAAFGAQHMRTSSFAASTYRTVPPPDVRAYPELLRQAGYFTMTSAKLDYQFSDTAPGTGPFTIWDAEGPRPDWSARRAGQPFYFLINLPQTHESRLFDDNVAEARAGGLQRTVDPGEVMVPPYYPDTPVVREAIARQYDNVHVMDRLVGEIMAALQSDGLLENTVVIWTTDHGDGLPRAKRELYDSGIHVPMVIDWPERWRPAGQTAGGVDDQLVSFVDLGPSILALAGVPVPGFMQGRPVLADPGARRQYVFAQKDRLDEFAFHERAVRDERFKYLRNRLPGVPGAAHIAYRDRLAIMQELWSWADAGRLAGAQGAWFEPRPAEELYDLDTDPHEVRNLAGDPAYTDVLQRLRDVLDKRLADIDRWGDTPEIDMARQFWPGGTQPLTPPPRFLRAEDGALILQAGIEGAALAWRVDDGPWQVVAPGTVIRPKPGELVQSRNVRYGWRESEVVSPSF